MARFLTAGLFAAFLTAPTATISKPTPWLVPRTHGITALRHIARFRTASVSEPDPTASTQARTQANPPIAPPFGAGAE
jgi:hypothetical protein